MPRFPITLAALLLAAVSLHADTPSLGGSEAAAVADAADAARRWAAPEWQPIWADEFDAPGLPDPARWTYEYGRVRNNEAQFYTRERLENARVEGGHLVITAVREPWEGAAYTSASLTTRGRLEFTYGKVEIRARVPGGRGTWPALWTLGANIGSAGWPLCGEIDILEHVGHTPDRFHFTVHTAAYNHTRGTQRGTGVNVPDPAEFHDFGILWSPERIEWFLDGRKVFEFRKEGDAPEAWPFTEPQYLLVNLAIGGAWGGQRGIDDTIFPAAFVIDHVRVYQMPEP